MQLLLRALCLSGKPSFADICLTVYELVRVGEVEDASSNDAQLNVGVILLRLLTEYPDKEEHLQQLLVVAQHGSLFPMAPTHPDFPKPHELKFSRAQVETVIYQDLQRFTEPKPAKNSYICGEKLP